MACLSQTAALSAARVANVGKASSGRLRSADSEVYALCASFSRRCSTSAAVSTDTASSCRPPLTVSPVAKRVCDLTGKKRNNGYSVSFSNHRTKKLQQPNLQWKRVWWEAGQRYVRLKLSTKAIKTLEWKGLETMAKEAGLDLSKL